MKELTVKSTKDEIFAAYRKTLDELKTKEMVKLDPAQVKKAKQRVEVLEKTKVLSTDSIAKSIEQVRTRTQNALAQIEQETTDRLNELKTTEEALAARQAELKDIFGIEAEASTLAALVEAQTERRVRFEQEQMEARTKFQEEMATARKAWDLQKQEYERIQRLQAEQDSANRNRALATSQYEFERDTKAKYDKLTDELTARTKAFEAEMELRNKQFMAQQEALAKREALQQELEAKVTALENEKVAMNAALDSKVNSAVEQAKKSAATSYAIEVNALKKTHEAQVMVLEGRVADLTARFEDLRNQNGQLTTKLEAAYNKVQSVAEKALEAQGNRETVAAVRQLAETGNQKR